MSIPKRNSITHGKYEELAQAFRKMTINDVINMPMAVYNGIGVTAKREGIKVATRKNGDSIDIYRTA